MLLHCERAFLILFLTILNWTVSFGQCEIQASQDTICPQYPVTLTAGTVNYTEKAYSFDGINDIIEIPNATKFHFGSNQDFTVECWVKNSTPAGSRHWIITNSGWSNNRRWQIGIDYGVIRASIGDGTNTAAGTGSVLVNDGNWHHIAVVYDRSSNMSVYVDGVLDFSQSISYVNNITNNINIGIGASTSPTGNHSYLNCEVDEVRIWNTARTAVDINSTMNTIINPNNYANLIAYYDFNDQSTSTIIDCAPNPSNGTVYGATQLNSSAIPVITLPYRWSTLDTTKTISVNPLTTTNYWVETGWCKYLCNDSITIVVNSLTTSSFLPHDTVICASSTFWLKPTVGFDSIVWSNGSTQDSILISAAGTFYAGASINGCMVFDTINISVIEDFKRESTQEEICTGDSYSFSVPVNPSVDSVFWFDGSTSIQRTFSTAGSFWYRRINDCFSRYDTLSLVLINCDTLNPIDTISRLFVPSAFTPNGDGKNEYFEIQGTGIKDYSLRIFNRWGEQVFYTNDMGVSWDGTSKGALVPSGGYTYLIEYRTWNNKYRMKKGTVSVYY